MNAYDKARQARQLIKDADADVLTVCELLRDGIESQAALMVVKFHKVMAMGDSDHRFEALAKILKE